MYPIPHAAIGYLMYVPYAYASSHRLPARWALIPLLLGTQFPDLIDKPLAYYDIVAYGRAVAHSLITFTLIVTIVWYGAKQLHDETKIGSWKYHLTRLTPIAFAIGYLSHIIADAHKPLLNGTPYNARWLLWPIYRLPKGVGDTTPPWVRLLDLSKNLHGRTEILLVGTALTIFIGLRLLARTRGEPIQNPEPPK